MAALISVMSTHTRRQAPAKIAPRVLAARRFRSGRSGIAETYLQDAKCYLLAPSATLRSGFTRAVPSGCRGITCRAHRDGHARPRRVLRTTNLASPRIRLWNTLIRVGYPVVRSAEDLDRCGDVLAATAPSVDRFGDEPGCASRVSVDLRRPWRDFGAAAYGGWTRQPPVWIVCDARAGAGTRRGRVLH